MTRKYSKYGVFCCVHSSCVCILGVLYILSQPVGLNQVCVSVFYFQHFEELLHLSSLFPLFTTRLELTDCIECKRLLESKCLFLFLSCFCCGRLRSMFLAGERCDVETLEWAKRCFAVPILDHWWQTGKTPFLPPARARSTRCPRLRKVYRSVSCRVQVMIQGLGKRRAGNERSSLFFSPSVGGVTCRRGAERLLPSR